MTHMDRGEFIRHGYSVEPGDGGSFIVVRGGRGWHESGRLAVMRGFTTFHHLIEWLAQEHKTLASSAQEGKEK